MTVESTDAIDSIGEWNDVIRESDTATFFQTKDWLLLWSKHFSKRLKIILAKHEDELVGITPLEINTEKQRIEILGTPLVLGGNSVTDYGDSIIKRGWEQKVWMSVVTFIHKNYPKYDLYLANIRNGSKSNDILSSTTLSCKKVSTAPYLDLPDTWDEYLSLLRRKDRKELKRKQKRLYANGVVEIQTGAKNIENMNTLLRLMNFSKEKSTFLSSEMRKFFQDIASTIDEKNMIFHHLNIEGRTIATTFSFLYKQRVYLYNSGFDYSYSDLSPGLILKAAGIRWAIERKYKVYDFLQGDERYKYNLGGQDNPIYTYS